MKITLYPETIREFLPITLRVSETTLPPNAFVKISSQSLEYLPAFTIPFTAKGDHWEASFWIQKAGVYQMEIASTEGKTVQRLEVRPQVFLDFSSEFGFFGLSFLTASALLILWFIKKRRKVYVS